jgi:hypothetical protein
MTPDQFIAKWKVAALKERSAAQSHFIDLCLMLDEPAPTDADPKGEWYAFERGATKTTGGVRRGMDHRRRRRARVHRLLCGQVGR